MWSPFPPPQWQPFTPPLTQVVALLTTAPAHHLKHRPLIRDFRDVRIQSDGECIKLELKALT
jgi:hypothetical protein